MSTVIDDTTGMMAAKLLEGWTLSAQICQQTPDCNVPLLTKGLSSFCGRCNASSSPAVDFKEAVLDSESSSASALSVSTPPTPSLALPADAAPVPRLSEAQRDAAAREIGNLLCKGWCLLGDYCPQCPGIPLMARPRPRPEPGTSEGSSRGATQARPPGRVCVNCRSEYISPSAEAAAPATGGAAARKRARVSEDQRAAKREMPLAPAVISSASSSKPAEMASASSDVAADTVEALEHALSVLSRQLRAASNSEPLNVVAMGELADAIGKAAQSLQLVRAL